MQRLTEMGSIKFANIRREIWKGLPKGLNTFSPAKNFGKYSYSNVHS